MTPELATDLHVPSRDIRIPTFLSAAAQSVLGMRGDSARGYPDPSDAQAWKTRTAEGDAALVGMLGPATANLPADVEEIRVDHVTVYQVTPHDVEPDDSRTYIDIHGGSLVGGGGAACRAMAKLAAGRVGATTWSVDYRMPPDHPYPAALDDCLAVYRELLSTRRPENIIVGGTSAGGNLAAALILRARDEGLPLPAGALLLTPEVDLTESGDSFQTNLGIDNFLTQSLMPANLQYAAGHDLRHPYLSPLFGDFGLGFPPTLLTTGTRDLFLSNTVRMHRALRAADIPAELHVLEAAPHGGFLGFAPEDAEIAQEVRTFVNARWGRRG